MDLVQYLFMQLVVSTFKGIHCMVTKWGWNV